MQSHDAFYLPYHQRYLSRVHDLASNSGLEAVTVALSKLGENCTKTCLLTSDGNSAQTQAISTPAQILSAVAENLACLRGSICIVENISPEYIKVLGFAWHIDPEFFVQHAANPRREHLWAPEKLEPDTKKEKFRCVNGNFEYHGLNMNDDEELNSWPNHFERHCFRSIWEGVETITSNTRISYYRVDTKLYLFLVDAPLNIQKRYDGTSRQFRPSLRLPFARNRGGLQLQPLFELRDKKGVYYSLSESLKSVFMHGWQRRLLFNYSNGLDVADPDFIGDAAFPAPPLCYMLSNSISRTNLRYLTREIRRISFQDIRNPTPKTNEILHDRREDLVAFFKAGLVETIRFVPAEIERFMEDLQHPTTSDHQRILDEALELERFLMETFQLLLSSISIQDASLSVAQGKLSNQQALRATQLTLLASIYVPLSFVTGIFGMNLKELNGSSLPIWVFFATLVVAVAVTAIIFLGLQTHSKKIQMKNDADKIKKGDEAGRKTEDTLKRPGQILANNPTVEKSMA